MIKQNIKIAIVTIVSALLLWLIASCFIKLDYSTKSIINFNNEHTTIVINNKESAYIENKGINKIKVEYEKQYFDCYITYESKLPEATSYMIFLPAIIARTTGYFETNVVIDSLNIYQYIFMK